MISQQTLYKLVDWFLKIRESYFFRQQRNPYRVWISEVVLQQTKIQAALEPLKRFFNHFPDIIKLANATEQEVLFAFRGLGYYSRARNLHKGAIYIVNHHDGKLPKSYSELLKIPSIGPYTAAAISSICFGLSYPVCDGNVKRVLIRMHKWNLAVQSKDAEVKSLEILSKLYQNLNVQPGDANEAIMELGQKICVRSRPKCDICPICSDCLAFQKNSVAKYPILQQKKEKIEVIWHLFVIVNNNQVVLQKWNDFYFLKKQISFPSILQFSKEKKYLVSWEKEIKNATALEKLIKKYNVEELPSVKHGITKHRIEIKPYIVKSKWQEKAQKNPYSMVCYHDTVNYLVASALIKVWENFINN